MGRGQGWGGKGQHTWSWQKRNFMNTPPTMSGYTSHNVCPVKVLITFGRMVLISHSLNFPLRWALTISGRVSLTALLKKLAVISLLPNKLSVTASPQNWRPFIGAPKTLLQPQFPLFCAPTKLDHVTISLAFSASRPLFLPTSRGPSQLERVPFYIRNVFLRLMYLGTKYPVTTYRKSGGCVLGTHKARSNFVLTDV